MASHDDASKRSNTEQDDGHRHPSPSSSENTLQPQAVRFASVNQEIEPAHSFQSFTTLSNADLSPEAQEEIRNLAKGLHNSHLQQRRMSNFAFEPISLPASRVCHPKLDKCFILWTFNL